MSHGRRPTLFLCWSGRRSKQVAEAFKDYFESVFKAATAPTGTPRIAMSETLIAKGAPWSVQLLTDLESARAGIVCLTPENRGSAWLHFEGGAIATQGLDQRERTSPAGNSANKLFGFLFTMDNTQIEGPLSLFQSTIYRRDYDRDRAELALLTRAVVERFEGCADAAKDGEALSDLLSNLLGKFRELHFISFREIVPGLEGHIRQVIQAVDSLGTRRGRLQALSAILSLQRRLEDRERETEVVCAPSQQMFFERLLEVLSASRSGLEQSIGQRAKNLPEPTREFLRKLRGMLEVAIEPLVPVLDDAWRYAVYGLYGRREEAYRKQKLLLIHPLESTLQRAELDARSHETVASDTQVRPGHLLSRNEKRRALRSYWAYDRVAAYVHYCEDVSRPSADRFETTLTELTRAVLKEIALAEVPSSEAGQPEVDDLPLRFAVRALVLKVKIGLGHGSYGAGDQEPIMDKPSIRAAIESRIKGETGLSFESVEQLIACLRAFNETIAWRSAVDLQPPLARLCNDLERLVGNRAESALSEPRTTDSFGSPVKETLRWRR